LCPKIKFLIRLTQQSRKTDISQTTHLGILGKNDKECLNKINIIEEQIDALFEFHQGQDIKASVEKLNN